jgi:hypothetical protein
MAPSEKGSSVGGQQPWKLRMLWEKKTPSEGRPGSAIAQPGKKRPVYEHPFLHDLSMMREEAEYAAAAAVAVNTSSLATWKALLLTRRRLQLDPAKHLYFLCESGSLGLLLSRVKLPPGFDIQWCGFLVVELLSKHAFSCRNESSG